MSPARPTACLPLWQWAGRRQQCGRRQYLQRPHLFCRGDAGPHGPGLERLKIFRIAKDKNCPETLQITAFSGHFCYTVASTARMLCQWGFCAAVARGAGPGAGLETDGPPGRQRASKVRLPLSGQLHGLRAVLQGAALRPGQKIAQPAEDGGNGQAVSGLGAPIAPVRRPGPQSCPP